LKEQQEEKATIGAIGSIKELKVICVLTNQVG
jgi:hypothetical protein